VSLASWKKEFYPKRADRTSRAEAASHSLRKWEGALPQNLKRHGVRFECADLLGQRGGYFPFNDSTCALCVHCYREEEAGADYSKLCRGCPLFEYLGKRCDAHKQPYRIAQDDSDPMPMIKALRRVCRKEQAAARKKARKLA